VAGETDPDPGQGVEVRRLHHRMSGDRQAVPAKLIERDQQDVHLMSVAHFLPPFDGLSAESRRRRLVVLLAVFIGSLAVMFVLMPQGDETIIGFELAGDSEAEAYLDAWRDDGLWRIALVLIADFPFLVAYGLGLALIIDWLADRSRPLHEGWARFLARFAWFPIVAAGFDVIENLALLVVLTDRTEGWPDLAASAATIKFALLYVAYAATAVAAGSALVANRRRARR
jgi:hypothetical protein